MVGGVQPLLRGACLGISWEYAHRYRYPEARQRAVASGFELMPAAVHTDSRLRISTNKSASQARTSAPRPHSKPNLLTA